MQPITTLTAYLKLKYHKIMPFSNYKDVNISKIGAFLAIDFRKVQITQNIEIYMSYSLRNLVKKCTFKI